MIKQEYARMEGLDQHTEDMIKLRVSRCDRQSDNVAIAAPLVLVAAVAAPVVFVLL